MQDDWFRFCLSQLCGGRGDRGDATHAAEDATQETALRVLRSIDHFDGRSTFKTWSFGVALNVCREIRRRRAMQNRRTSGIDLADVAEPINGEADPMVAVDDALSAGVRTEAIRAALADLPDRQREVVTLRYLESLSVAETADAMGCAAGTVKAALFAALRTMRRKLSGAEQDL